MDPGEFTRGQLEQAVRRGAIAPDPLYSLGDNTNIFEYQYLKQKGLGHMSLGLPIGKVDLTG
jgi:hypothetical protein